MSYRKEGGGGGVRRREGKREDKEGRGERGWGGRGQKFTKRRLLHNLDHWKLLQNRIGQN